MARRTRKQLKGDSKRVYLRLVSEFPLESIGSENERRAAQKIIDRLLEMSSLSEAEEIYLNALIDLVSAFELKQQSTKHVLEDSFPAIASWIHHGWIEIGDQEMTGFSAMAFDCGGMVYEAAECETLGQCIRALENGLRDYMKERWNEEF